MSRALLRVRFNDGLILQGVYSGTSDSCYPPLQDMSEELIWRPDVMRRDEDIVLSEPVVIASDYGGGFYWEGEACRTSKQITKGFHPFGLESWATVIEPVLEITDGHPDWWNESG